MIQENSCAAYLRKRCLIFGAGSCGLAILSSFQKTRSTSRHSMPIWLRRWNPSPTHTTRARARSTRHCSRISSPGWKSCPAVWMRAPVGETSSVQTCAVFPDDKKFTLRGMTTGRRSERTLWKYSSFKSGVSVPRGWRIALTIRIVARVFVQIHSGFFLRRTKFLLSFRTMV
jgi:hypothetical protein